MGSMMFDSRYYGEVMRAFGYSPIAFEPISFSLGGLAKEDLQRQWLCHMDGTRFARMLQSGRKAIVTTGFGLSGIPHMGTLAQILKAIRLQQAGVPVQIVLGDLDAYNGKNIDLGYAHELAISYARFIADLGFNSARPNALRNQHDALPTLRYAYLIGHHLADADLEQAEEDLHDLYSQQKKVDSAMSYRRKLSLNLMIADFIELLALDGFDAVLVSLGIDEHKYVDLGRTVFQRQTAQSGALGGKVYSAMYSSIIRGFNGYPKMSKSFPDSGLSVDMPLEEIERSIMHGEMVTPFPETNVVFQMIASVSRFSNEQIREAYTECRKQSRGWTCIKQDYTKHLFQICRAWPKRSLS